MPIAALASALLLLTATPDLTLRQQEQGTRVPDVTVTGRTTEEAVRDFVGRVAAPPRGRGVARWDGPVCPGAVNLDREAAEIILDRIGEAARSLDLRVGRPGCRANLVVVFTTDGADLARTMVEEDRRLFDPGVGGIARDTAALEAFQTGDAPVRWWSLSMTFDTATGQRSVRVPGDMPTLNVLPLHTARAINCSPTDCPILHAPVINVTSTSRLRTQIADALYKTIIIVDVDRIGDIDAARLGDYLAFIGLAQIAGEADTTEFDSILNLFEGGGQSGLTAWDRAYLEAVYGTRAGVRSSYGRIREVADLMVRNQADDDDGE